MDVVDELKRLVSIPSVTGNEGDIGRYIFNRFRELGCMAELFQVSKNRYNVFAVLPGDGKSDGDSYARNLCLLFHAHMDTVPPYKMKKPFEPVVTEGYLWGRGSVDQKGGIAAVIGTFQKLASDSKRMKRLRESGKRIGFIGVIDEESEHRGSMAMKEMGIGAGYAVVTEPSGLKVGVGCKGTVPVRVTVHGKSSHGCRPWLGKNAIEYAMRIARDVIDSELPVMEIYGMGNLEDPVNLGKTSATINLGIIQGGVAYNIVPDECVLWFDRRLIPGENPDDAVEAIKGIASRYNKINNIKIKVEVARPDWNWEPIKKRGLRPALTPLDSRIVTVAREAHEEITGEKPIVYFTDGYNEMDFLVNDLGIPTIQYGPGDAALCHTNEEKMNIEELKSSVDVYSSIIEKICR